MRVQFTQNLMVTDNYQLGNRGSITLSEGGLVFQPTQVVDSNDAAPEGTATSGTSNVTAVQAFNLANQLRSVILDDSSALTPASLPFVNNEHTLPLSSTTSNLAGVLDYGFSAYRVHPSGNSSISFSYAPRPAFPGFGTAANLEVVSFNVLNYFNGDGSGGGLPTSRGAHSLAEFSRQRDKILSALIGINADVLGVIEMENDGTGAASAIQDLVNGLNAHFGAHT